MKKVLFLLFIVTLFTACMRQRKQPVYIRPAQDSTVQQRNSSGAEDADNTDNWRDDPLLDIPDVPGEVNVGNVEVEGGY